MEKLGYHRRDLMVNRVESARDAQDDAKEEFESAYGGVHKRGRRFYQFDGKRVERLLPAIFRYKAKGIRFIRDGGILHSERGPKAAEKAE